MVCYFLHLSCLAIVLCINVVYTKVSFKNHINVHLTLGLYSYILLEVNKEFNNMSCMQINLGTDPIILFINPLYTFLCQLILIQSTI